MGERGRRDEARRIAREAAGRCLEGLGVIAFILSLKNKPIN